MKIGEITIGPNPTMTIYQVKIDNDTMITLGRFKDHSQFTEVYTGENYVVGSEKRSYSRIYKGDDFSKLLQNAPAKYAKHLVELKQFELNTQEC
jgi:hypothetical protein